jgi:hypothetical protein
MGEGAKLSTSPFAVAKNVLANEGIKGFYKG